MKLKRYDKTFDYSYTVGMFPTVELLRSKPDHVLRIVCHSKFESVEGRRELEIATERHGIPYEQNDRLIEKLCPKRDCLVLGVFKKYASQLDPVANHIVLVYPSNSGNLGTIIRSMLAFDFHDLAIIEPAVDVFSPSTIRSSMGALFGVRFEHFGDFDAYTRTHGTHHLYSLATAGAHQLEAVAFQEPYSLLFGNESSGLPDECQVLGESIRIDQSTNVDSLNLAISTGIVLHHLYRSRTNHVEDHRHFL